MMLIIHAQEDSAPEEILTDMHAGYGFGKAIVLVGTPHAFEDTALPDSAGQVGGTILRITYLHASPSAFEVLADCARLCKRLLAEDMVSLRYARAGACPPDTTAGSAPVTWTSGPEGIVTTFQLSPCVASSPLLMSLSADLLACPTTEERRFALLAAAFKET